MAVNVCPGDPDPLCAQAAFCHDAFDLTNDFAAAVVRCLRSFQHIQPCRLLIKADVAALVCVGAADDRDVDGEGLVHQIIDVMDLDVFHQIFLGHFVQLSALQQRIHKGILANLCDQRRALCCDLAIQVADDALREIVSLDFIVDRHCLHLRRPAPVTAYDTPDHALVGKAGNAGSALIANAGGMHQGQVCGMACIQKAFLDSLKGVVRLHHTAAAARDHYGIPILNQSCRLFACHDLRHLFCLLLCG